MQQLAACLNDPVERLGMQSQAIIDVGTYAILLCLCWIQTISQVNLLQRPGCGLAVQGSAVAAAFQADLAPGNEAAVEGIAPNMLEDA